MFRPRIRMKFLSTQSLPENARITHSRAGSARGVMALQSLICELQLGQTFVKPWF